MKLKTISIVLPKKMIQEIDEMLLEENFASRSDFFRHLVRMSQLKKEPDTPVTTITEKSKDEFETVDCEYGIPPEVIKRLEEKAKLPN